MKLFVVLSCVVLASAIPAYHYNTPILTGGFGNGGFNGGYQLGGGSGFGNGFASGNSFGAIPQASFQQARVVNSGPVLVGGGPLTYSSQAFGNGYYNGNGLSNGPFGSGLINSGSVINTAQAPTFIPSGPAQVYTTGAANQQILNAVPSPAPAPVFLAGPSQAPLVQNSANFVSGASAQRPATIQKHIYVHVPPPEQEEVRQQTHFLPAAPPQKHYKIIFIKAPTVQQNNAALIQQAAAAQTQEKTLVYVLVKKPEDNAQTIINQQIADNFQPTKPEVFFIKYKSKGNVQQQQLQQQGAVINEGQAQGGIGAGSIINDGANFGANVITSGQANSQFIAPAIQLDPRGQQGNTVVTEFSGGQQQVQLQQQQPQQQQYQGQIITGHQQGFGTGASNTVLTSIAPQQQQQQQHQYVSASPKPNTGYGVPH